RAVRYHNVTPPEFFAGISGDYANICRLGRDQLQPLADFGCDRYLFASDYNRQEFLALGVPAERTSVVLPFHHTDRPPALPGGPAALTVWHAFREAQTNLLTVSRPARTNWHAFLLYASAASHRGCTRASRLPVVGNEAPRLKGYSGCLPGLAEGLGVQDAV